MESNVTPSITRSSDTFSTVNPIVNGGDWECIVHNLETIIVLVLLAFKFHSKRSHHSLIRIRDSATVTLKPGNDTTAIKVKSSVSPISLFYRMVKSPEVKRRNNNGRKKLPRGTPDMLTGLL